MIVYLLLGISMGFAAAVQPGPTQLYIISRALLNGWKHTLPLASVYIVSDIPIVSAVLLVLTNIPDLATDILRLVGGGFLLYLAWGAINAFRKYEKVRSAGQSRVQNYVKAVTINLLNPNPYLTWSLVMGPMVLEAWKESSWFGVSMVAGFYGAIVLSTAGIIFLFSGIRRFGPQASRILIGIAALALAGFGIYQIVMGIVNLVK